MKKTSDRRHFIQKASLGLGGMAISPLLSSKNEPVSALHEDAKN
ncbi:MAG TPA: hypothetical protein VK622_11055 [Puia sp.]|nr:hypothetical protein [Puia sp.]